MKKLFIQCEYGTAETRCIWSVINRRDGKNVGWIMIFADIVCKLMESFVYNSGNYKTV